MCSSYSRGVSWIPLRARRRACVAGSRRSRMIVTKESFSESFGAHGAGHGADDGAGHDLPVSKHPAALDTRRAR
jgi:hypothetical protein